MWPSAAQVTHWSLMNMEQRAQFLGLTFERTYQLYYSLLSWYVHSGTTGLSSLTTETFANLCGVAYTIITESYCVILESVIDEFGIHRADEKLKDKITLAKMLPFTESPEQANQLRRELLGDT
jgi:hypothetical protein